MYKVEEFINEDGTSPFAIWLRSLDRPVQARIQARVFRFATGNLGDIKNVGDGVIEARLFFGKGYRLYFSIVDKKLILLLLGGDKSYQSKDIKKAKSFFKIYKENQNA